jgi:hypothetical protein
MGIPTRTRQFFFITLLVGLLIALATRLRNVVPASTYSEQTIPRGADRDSLPVDGDQRKSRREEGWGGVKKTQEVERKDITPPNRRPLYAAIFAVLLISGFLLPRDVTAPMFLILVVGSMGVGLHSVRGHLRPAYES